MFEFTDPQDQDPRTSPHPTAMPSTRQLRALLRYWGSRRSGTDLPRRSDIDPRGIEDLLPHTFILERIAPGLARFRVAGTHLAELVGLDVRGMPVSTLIAPAARADFSEALGRVFDAPAILRLRLRAERGPLRPALSARMLILPLRNDMGEVARAIGCLVTEGRPGQTPRRFEIAAQSIDPVALAGPAAPGLAPAPGNTQGQPRLVPPRPGQPGYLRLVAFD